MSRSSLSFFLITVALSTFAWLVRFSTRVADVPSIQKHTNKSLQTAHFTEPSSELQQMQYLRQMGELIYPETPPARSEKAAKTLHVAQREPGAEKQPGVTRFVCLSDTHGLHIDSHSGSQVLEVGFLLHACNDRIGKAVSKSLLCLCVVVTIDECALMHPQ